MEPVECKVIAAPVHERWLQAWAAQAHAGVRLHPCRDGTPAADDAAPCDVMLMLVGRDTLPWARQQLLAWKAVTPVLAVTRDLSGTMIQSLLALGACDFLASERSGDELKTRLWRLREQRRAGAPARPGLPEGVANPLLGRLIGANDGFVRQLARVPVIAASDAGVLILGETGTGKELCAQAIHYLSRRRGAPFVAVNCGALPAELVEAELFGHARGAYTSAHAEHGGLVAEAEGGTFFLDEVDSMPAGAQVKLLRFLQDHEYRPVGSTKAQRADVRVVAATNTNIDALAAQGRFRRDLYYRLNILSITLPPLRERRDDVALLAHHFVARLARDAGRAPATLTRAALAKLAGHDWPGNVRELEHALERALLLCQGDTIGADDLDLPAAAGQCDAASFCHAKAQAVQAFERAYLERVLVACQGNITHAAHASGKDRRAFWELIRKHGIDAARYRG